MEPEDPIDIIKPDNKSENDDEASASKKLKIEIEEGMIVDDDEDEGEINEDDEPEVCVDLVKNQIHTLVKLLDSLVLIGRDGTAVMDTVNVLKLVKLTVKYFFWNLTERNTIMRLIALGHVNSLLGLQCQNKAARAVALIDLLEGSLFTYCNLFGMQIEKEKKNKNEDRFLMLHNQKIVSTKF